VSLLYRNKGFTLLLTLHLLDKTDKFSGIEPVLLRNYQIYSGMVIKGANKKSLNLLSIFNFFSDKVQVPMLTLNTEGLTYDDYYWIGAS
jgi:hypothetical protein